MARSGNGASAHITRATPLAAQTAFTVVLTHKSASAPSGAADVCPLFLGDGANFKLAFYWDQAGGASVPLWRWYDGAADVDVAYVATPATNTWYRLAVRVSAAGFDIWLDGALVASAAAPAMPAQTFGVSIGSRVNPNGDWDSGTNAEVAIYDVALADAELVALTGGQGAGANSPLLVRIEGLKFHADLISDIFDWSSSVALTDSGSAIAAHVACVYPAEVPAAYLSVSEFAAEGDVASGFGVFGPRTERNRIERHFFWQARRWRGVALDSFSRANADRAGDADSGHTWSNWSGDAIAQPFRIVDSCLRPKLAVRGAAWTAMAMGLTDVRVRVRITYRTAFGDGLGIVCRLSETGEGLLFHYASDGHFYLSAITVPIADAAPTVTHNIDFGATPALVIGTSYLFELRALGTTLGCFLDGTQLGANTSWSLGRGETRHGLFVTGNFANCFDNVRVIPQTRAW